VKIVRVDMQQASPRSTGNVDVIDIRTIHDTCPVLNYGAELPYQLLGDRDVIGAPVGKLSRELKRGRFDDEEILPIVEEHEIRFESSPAPSAQRPADRIPHLRHGDGDERGCGGRLAVAHGE